MPNDAHAADPLAEPRVDAAIDRAARELRARQSSDGGWRTECDQGPATTAQAAIVLAWLGRLSDEEAASVCRWLAAQQLPDGGWASGPLGGASELGATAIGYAALERLGGDASARARARACLDRSGGIAAAGSRVREADAAPWYLAIAGVLDGRALPRIPLAWRRSARLVRLLEARVHDGVQLLVTQLGAIGRRLSGEWGETPGDRADADAVLALLDTYQNPDGSWGGFVPLHALALAAAWSCGDRGPRVERGVAWLRSRMRRGAQGCWFNAYDPDVWTTSISLRVLRLCAEADDPALVAAAGYLVRAQSLRPQAPGLTRRSGALRIGGWGFGAANIALPDTDDTGQALLAFTCVRTDDDAVARAGELGEAWLRAMQNPDGAFPAFTWNVSRRPDGALDCPAPGPLGGRDALRRLRALVPQLTDYPSEDAAGRILRAFAARGARLGDPAVDGTVAWLRRQQGSHGGWWGRWVTAYVSGTADVLQGLHAVGVPEADPMIRGGVEFLLARQQPDGGWGETPDAYLDVAAAGAGPSNAALTGWALPGLLPCLGPDHAAVRRGVRYLLDTQLPNGDWPQGNHVHVYLPPDRVYRLPASSLMHPLEALAMWRRARIPPPRTARGTSTRRP